MLTFVEMLEAELKQALTNSFQKRKEAEDSQNPEGGKK
jgi:hypothetical protein